MSRLLICWLCFTAREPLGLVPVLTTTIQWTRHCVSLDQGHFYPKAKHDIHGLSLDGPVSSGSRFQILLWGQPMVDVIASLVVTPDFIKGLSASQDRRAWPSVEELGCLHLWTLPFAFWTSLLCGHRKAFELRHKLALLYDLYSPIRISCRIFH